MDTPGATVEKLIKSCQHVTKNWPLNGIDVIYVRVYTHLDPQGIDLNSAGLYGGQSKQVQVRDGTHTRGKSKLGPRIQAKQVSRCLPITTLRRDPTRDTVMSWWQSVSKCP